MPEGDTIHKIANALRPRLVARRVTCFELPRREMGTDHMIGRRIEAVEARGKYLAIAFEGGVSLLTHLKMTGRWYLQPAGSAPRGPRSRLSVAFSVLGAEAQCYGAPLVRLVKTRSVDRSLGHLGPDILSPEFDLAEAVARLRRPPDRAALGEALLDQTRIAGFGNVWKSEACFHERVSPFDPVSRIAEATLLSLVSNTRRAMQLAVASTAPRSVTLGIPPRSYFGLRRPSRGSGALRTTQDGSEVGKGAIFVYGRKDRPCFTCATPIEMRQQGESPRSTYYCPRCQDVESEAR